MKAALLAVLTVSTVGCGGSHAPAAMKPLVPGRPAGDIQLTRNVPCPNGRQRGVGPAALGRFHAVAAVSCVDGTRIYPGQGKWRVLIRRVAVGDVSGLQRYFEQPDERNLPKGGGCLTVLVGVLVPVLVDAHGRWLVPRTPVDGCGHPLGFAFGRIQPRLRWHVVSTRKVKLEVSAAALAAHCAMGIKDLPAGGIGPLRRSSGGPLFSPAPKTVQVGIYRTPPHDFEVGSFVRGFRLDHAQTIRLLGALTRSAPTESCRNERTFALIQANRERWAEVELGGCRRVGRTYPGYGLGGANASVVSALLGHA